MRRRLTPVMLAPAPPRLALAHLDEDLPAVGLTHNQIDLATPSAGRAETALHQPQSMALQMRQRRVFGRVAALFGRDVRRLLPGIPHCPHLRLPC